VQSVAYNCSTTGEKTIYKLSGRIDMDTLVEFVALRTVAAQKRGGLVNSRAYAPTPRRLLAAQAVLPR